MSTQSEELTAIIYAASPVLSPFGAGVVADALIPFIERTKAKALRDAANNCGQYVGDWLCERADAIEKGV